MYRVKLIKPDGTYEVKRFRGRNESISEADSFIESGGSRAYVSVDTPDGLKPTYTRIGGQIVVDMEDLPAVKEV